MSAATPTVLPEHQWRARERAHAERVDAWVAPHLERRQRGEAHPVLDFLFTYYSQRPAALRRWHPGADVVLQGAEPRAGYVEAPGGLVVDPALVEQRRAVLTSVRRLLVATQGRPASFGCFGLHEWAMVHRSGDDRGARHPVPLRLGPAGTDAVVESHRVACSHFDAFRFFTPTARPLNTLSPGRDDRPDFEQPGCLHAGMDLYKHAFRLSPLVDSELVADCFALARDIRELDMRASPYDLEAWGYAAVPIETTEGKAVYVAAQRGFTERGAPLRARLVAACERLLSDHPSAASTPA